MATKTFGEITTGVQSFTATGALTPTAGLDISGITGDYTVHVQLESLTAGKKCLIQLEDSVNAFTASVPIETWNPIGSVAKSSDQKRSWRKYQIPSLRAGTASAVLRVNVTQIDSATTGKVHAWIEY
jgi:hypothetical protein